MKVPEPRKMTSGKWFIQLRINGKSISVTDANKKKCVAKATAIKAGIIEDDRLKHAPTLSVAIDHYIDARSNVLSPSTIRGYRAIQKGRFIAYQDTKVDKLDKQACQRMVNIESALCSAKTLQNAWLFLAAVIYTETGKRYDVRLPQVVAKERPFFTPDQIKTFLDVIYGTTIEVPALLGLCSLRASEMLALRWQDIDLHRGLITVRGAVVLDENGQYVRKVENKNKSSRRTVPIMIPRLAELLQEQREEHDSAEVIVLTRDGLLKHINRLCRANDLPQVGVHGLRHSFASLAYHLQMPEKIAMEIGGWSDNKTMHNIYTHIAQSDKDHYATAMQQFFLQNAN